MTTLSEYGKNYRRADIRHGDVPCCRCVHREDAATERGFLRCRPGRFGRVARNNTCDGAELDPKFRGEPSMIESMKSLDWKRKDEDDGYER